MQPDVTANLNRTRRRARDVASLMAAAALAGAVQGGPKEGGKPALPPPGQNAVKVRAMADVAAIVPGSTFHLVLLLDVPELWHIYWTNPGAGAAPTTVRVSAPEGFTVGKARLPRPLIYVDDLGETFAHEGTTALFVPVTAPTTLGTAECEFSAQLNWAVCAHICRFEHETVALSLPARADATSATGAIDPIIAQHRARLPQPLKDLKGAVIRYEGSTLTIEAPAGGHRTARLIADPSPGVSVEDVAVTMADGRASLTAQVKLDPGNSLGKPMILRGLLALGDKPTDPSYEFELSMQSGS